MNVKHNRAGVTAIEIVLVFVIIILIAAVLFPVLVPHDHGCGHSTCQSNMKECALAVQLYWGDYDSTLPSSALVSHAKKWNRRDFRTFATKAGKLPPAASRRTWAQVIYDKMKNNAIMFCQSDPIWPERPWEKARPNTQCSYWWKTAIDKAWYGVGCKKPCRRETDFAYNSDIIMLYEHIGWHFGDQSGLKDGVRINVAFMDTHVKTIALTNATSGDPINSAANSDGEPMYFNFDNTKPKGKDNPPPKGIPARHIDPGRYSDMLP